jgi:hypothetical protein
MAQRILRNTNLCEVYYVAAMDPLPMAAAPMTAINKSLRQLKKINHRSIEMVVY